MINELKTLIEQSERILVTSHISPDPDAVSSALLLGTTLKTNYPGKKVEIVLEEKPDGLDFIAGFEQIAFRPIYEALQELKPDLFVLLDGNNYERFSRHNGQEVRDYIKINEIKVAIIDHHEEQGKDDANIYINRQSAATAQEVYEICFDGLGLKKPSGATQTAMTGFYADTGGFVYMKAGQQDRAFDFAKKLVGEGANVEQIKNQLETYNLDDLTVLQELIANISSKDGYTYSFLRDQFVNEWLAKGLTYPQMQKGTNMFLNDFIRSIEGRPWGFIVYKNTLQGPDYYSVSLRAQGGAKDVAAIATALGGGGHKPAAGAKIKASSLDEAIQSVKNAIN